MPIDYDSLNNPTAEQLLILVNNAIAGLLLGGKSWTINGKTFTQENLKDLQEMRTTLQAEINSASVGNIGVVVLGGRQR